MPSHIVHYRDLRLFVHENLTFPICASGSLVLDRAKAAWTSTADLERVTCQRCITAMNERRREYRDIQRSRHHEAAREAAAQ